jgi:hypothetical protein
MGIRGFCVVVICGALLSGCSSEPPPPEFRPVTDVQQLMEWILDPSADVIWGAVGTIVSEAGTEELAPSTDEEWANVRNHAAIIAESANLLLMTGRAQEGPEWTQYAHGLIDTAMVAMKAAEAKDRDALFNAGGEIYSVCVACHQMYVDEMREGLPR